MFIK
jgi:hypothetical protein